MHGTNSAALHRPAMQISLSPTLDAYRDFWPTTAALGEARCFPFQCADVLEILASTLGRSQGLAPLFVCVADAAGRPALLLPLALEQSLGTRVLRFLDCGVNDYNAPVIFPAAIGRHFSMHDVWSLLRQELPPFDLAVFEKMPDMVAGFPNPLVSLATAPHPESSHAVTLDLPCERFASERLPSSSDSKRCLRKLNKRGSVEFEIAQTDAQRDRLLEALFRQKQRQFVETKVTDLFADPTFGEFYTRAMRRLGNPAVLLSGLSLDGRVIAANWGYLVGDRYYDLITSHEGGEFRSFAPGRLLNEWLIGWCIRNGVKFYDFGIGDEPYKFRYCDVHIPLRDAYLPVTLRGGLFTRMLRLRTVAKARLRDTAFGAVLKAARNRLRNSELKPPAPLAQS
jgi:CelD/BcsL family acetyltransferase involved in cellulose biosynthesis